jgi:hypothetical protein
MNLRACWELGFYRRLQGDAVYATGNIPVSTPFGGTAVAVWLYHEHAQPFDLNARTADERPKSTQNATFAKTSALDASCLTADLRTGWTRDVVLVV